LGLGGHFFELRWASEVESGMVPDGIVEPVNVAGDGLSGFPAGVKDGPPHELGFQRLEEGFDHRVVVAVSLPDIEIRMPCLLSAA
jgi:hypothetical protein